MGLMGCVECMGNEHKILVRKPERKIPLKNLRRSYVNNIIINLREMEF
jgi:hypothetical protein